MTLKEVLKAMGGMYQNKQSGEALSMLLFDLQGYPEIEVINALKKCRQGLKYFPTLVEILDRLDGGHLGPNEAWAICPKDEISSVCWTREIEKAYFVAYPLIVEGDVVAARMAFLEAYKKELSSSRSIQKLPDWRLSLGTDKLGREAAIQEATRQNKISYQQSKNLLPNNNPIENENVLKITNNITKAIE